MRLSAHTDNELVVDLHVNYRICQHCQIPLIKTKGNQFVNAFEWLKFGALLEAFSVGAGLPRLSAAPAVYIQKEHVLAVDELSLPDRFCVVHRESSVAEKDWLADKWSELATIVREDLLLPIVEVGAGPLSGTTPLGDQTIDLCNRLPLLQTAEVIRRASLFIGIDSGPAHFANAVRTPGVVLLGRHAGARQYTPYTGFFASDAPDVQLVRNLTGPTQFLTVHEVAEAVRYVAGVTPSREAPARQLPSPADVVDHRGSRDRVLQAGFFDPAWYRTQYPDVDAMGFDALDHYLTIGTHERREPGPDFSAADYRIHHEDVEAAGVDPLVHYSESGIFEGRSRFVPVLDQNIGDELSADIAIGAISDHLAGMSAVAKALKPTTLAQMPRTFAFYLPQFHPIPENDWAHGMGFTEWNNVVDAKPLFRGHYQPRKPGELGFYDLRSSEVLERQLSLAAEHGIDGFCFYYYYFKGRKLLQKPFRNFIDSATKTPFLLLWANENWSKRWDGGDKEVIIAQHHSRDDDLAFIREVSTLFQDDRYVRVRGKPVLMIYKTHLFPNITATVETWREEIERLGFPGIYLVMVDDWSQDLNQPQDLGFDATYEIPSNLVPANVLDDDAAEIGLKKDFTGRIVDYRKFAAYHAGRPFPQYKRFRTVMLPWDNTARYASRAMVHTHGTGEAYKLWLLQALLETHRRYDREERIVFLHSWNEWCEGTYLEPDGKLGRLYLNQTRDAIQIARQAIALGGSEHAEVVSALLRVQQIKDEGAFRVLNAARVQTSHLWREAEFRRQHILTLEAKIARLERANAEVTRS